MIGKSQNNVHILIISQNKESYENFITLYKDENDDSYKHFAGQILPDNIDPSYNFTAARILHDLIGSPSNIKIQTVDDYATILKKRPAQYFDPLIMINDCQQIKRINNGKIYFIQEECLPEIIKDTFQFEKFSLEKLTTLTQQEIELFSISEETLHFLKEEEINQFLKEQVPMERRPKMALLRAEPHWAYEGVQQALFKGFFQDANENWDIYNLFQGHYPQDFSTYKGLIITGSAHNAYDGSVEWIETFGSKLGQFVKKQLSQEGNSETKIVGVCWGHQALGNFCGGKVAKMHHGNMIKQSVKMDFQEGFFNKVPQFQQSPYFKSFRDEHIQGTESHSDHVFELPEKGILLASSKECQINMMAIDNVAVGIQPHPEYNWTIIYSFLRILGGYSEEYIKNSESTFSDGIASNLQLCDVLNKFLKN